MTSPAALFHSLRKSSVPRSSRIAFIFATALLLIGTTVADIYPIGVGNRFIGHADEADLAMVARNIAEGRGPVSDVVWLLTDGGMPGNSVTHPEDYWSVYSAVIIAVLFKLFGATRPVLLLAASLFKTGTALLCGYWVSLLTKCDRLATFSGIAIVALWPAMLRTVQGLSDIYLTFFLLLFATWFALALARERPVFFLLSGLAAGVSIAVKPSGGLLLGVVAAFIVLARKIVLKPVNFASLTMGAVMALAPLAIFNLGAFGELAILRPPAYPLIAEASEIRALTGDHNLGFYDPERPRSRPAGAKQNVKIALDRLSSWIREGVLGGNLIPSFMWFFVPCFFLERYFKHGNIWPMPSAERVFAGIVVLLSLGGVVLACVVHYEERYWNFLFPLLAIVTIVAMTGMRRYFLPLLLVYTFSSAALYYHDRKIEVASPAYALLAQLVPRDSVILTPNPWETTFHTRIKSVATPYTDNEQALQRVARRYGAEYLVIIDRDARHPFYYPMQNFGEVPPFLEKVFFSRDLLVAKFKSANKD